MRFFRYHCVAALMTMLISASGADVLPTTPVLFQNEPGRIEYLLNGLYHFKVFDHMPEINAHANDSGIFARVPGEWFDTFGNSDQFVDSHGKVLPRFPGSTPQNWKQMAPYGLYELNFTTPSGLNEKTVILNVAGCHYLAEIYFNGVLLGTQQKYENNFYNVSSLLKKDGQNNLKIAVRGFVEIPRAYGSEGVDIGVSYSGIMHDVKLIGLDHALLCRFTGLQTDLRKQEATFTITVENYSDKPVNGDMQLELSRDNKLIIKCNTSAELIPGQSRIPLTIPLKNIKLWEPDTPELYGVKLHVSGKSGQILASIPSAITGFRQAEIKDGKFILNGHIATLFGDSASRINLLPAQCVGAYPEQVIACLKSLGHNFANLQFYFTQELPLQIADYYGFMLVPALRSDADMIFKRHALFPGLTTLNGRQIPASEITSYLKQFRDMNEYFALHPSIIGYARNFNWLCESEKAYQPQLAGLKDHAVNERADFADKMLRETTIIDPSKIHYNHHGGGYGPVYTHNRYWSTGVPLQEKCDFLKLWSDNDSADKMPYMVTEGWMYSGGPYIYPKWGVSSRNSKWTGLQPPYMWREISALQCGSDAYFNKIEQSDLVVNVQRQTAAYRYYGVMGHLLHTDTYLCYTPGQLIPVKEQLQDNIPGFVSRNNLWGNRIPSTAINELGQTFKHVFSGFTFFIMGDAANPTGVEHNFYSDSQVTKNVLVINETGITKKVEFDVRLCTSGQTLMHKKIMLELKPGERTMYPLKLTMPKVDIKTALSLSVALGKSEQIFQFTVFPAYSDKLETSAPIAYYDVDSSVGKLLDFYGVKNVRDLNRNPSLKEIKVVVVGRNAMSIPFGRLAARLNMAQWVRNGGRIIVLEQSGSSVLGLALDKRRARNVFIAIPGHPVFSGLSDADLADWQGKSSLLQEFPSAGSGFHWSEPLVTSTTGIVSSFTVEKPHIGSFLPLLESGYDLQFSPLLELRDGNGIIWLSQLDLAGRIGLEPAATVLFGNLLKYAIASPVQEPRKYYYAGADDGRKFLKSLGADVPDLPTADQLSGHCGLIVGAGANKVLTAAAVERIVRAGGIMICLPSFDAEELLPFKISRSNISTDKAFSSANDATVRTLPVSISDTCWHDKFLFSGWKFENMPNRNPLLDGIPIGHGRVIYCRVNPATFENHYFKMKPYRLWSTILTAVGVPLTSMVSEQLYNSGANTLIPLGNSAWFRLDRERAGTNLKWMSQELPMDLPWEKIIVPGSWKKTPYLKNFGPVNPPAAAASYNGDAWYRFEVEIPKDMEGLSAVLQLGAVDDYDTCYFNGIKIGGMGKAFGAMVYDTERVYRIPEKLIHYGSKNVIAVRVEDVAGDGGITRGKPRIEFFSGESLKCNMYLPNAGIMDVFGVTPYYNEQW